MKKTLIATAAIAAVAATASAVEVEMYGQVNKGVYAADDGHHTDTLVVDNARDSTKLGVKGAQALDNGLTASVLFEGEMADNASDALIQNNSTTQSTTPNNAAAATFTSRQARVGVSGHFGGVYIGKQSTAYDGVLLQDLTGAQDVLGAAFNEIGGGLAFRTKGTGALNTAQTINSKTNLLDENRANSVRYDSPIFNGIQGRVSVAQGGDLDMGAFYDGGMGDFKVAGAVGYYLNNDNTDFRGTAQNTTTSNADDAQMSASVSVKHKSGIAGTVAYTKDSLTRKQTNVDDPSTWYAKVGYAWDAFEVAADYGNAQDYTKVNTTGNTDEVKAMGLGAQYNVADGVSVAAMWRSVEAELTGSNLDDINLYGVNMKVRF